MSERNAYNAFRKGIIRGHDRIDRVENLSCYGMPDVNGCFEGSEFWMELKQAKEPKRASTPLLRSQHGFSVEQQNWMMLQVRAGGKAFAYIETDKRRLLISGDRCFTGALQFDLNQMTVLELIEISCWIGPRKMRKGEWDVLRQEIIGWK